MSHAARGAPVRFDDALLFIFRAARTEPLLRFQALVLGHLETLLGFDSAIWGVGLGTATDTFIGGVYLHQQTERMMREYEAVRADDVTGMEACANPGRAVRVSATDAHVTDAMRRHMHGHGMAHVLCTAILEADLGLFNFMSCYRARADRPWSDRHARLHERLMPHLVEAYLLARHRELESGRAGDDAPLGYAIAGEGFMTLNMTPRFRRLMIEEWPRWRGPHLPRPVRRAFDSEERTRFDGRRIVLEGHRAQGLAFLSARARAENLSLGVREREVARLLVRGASHKEVARELDISPHTARNHIRSIYRKLDVHTRLECAARLRDL